MVLTEKFSIKEICNTPTDLSKFIEYGHLPKQLKKKVNFLLETGDYYLEGLTLMKTGDKPRQTSQVLPIDDYKSSEDSGLSVHRSNTGTPDVATVDNLLLEIPKSSLVYMSNIFRSQRSLFHEDQAKSSTMPFFFVDTDDTMKRGDGSITTTLLPIGTQTYRGTVTYIAPDTVTFTLKCGHQYHMMNTYELLDLLFDSANDDLF